MTANEMFEDVGFEKTQDGPLAIEYMKTKKIDDGVFQITRIAFVSKEWTIISVRTKKHAQSGDHDLTIAYSDMKTTKAILKQLEELGWLNE